MEQVCNGKMTLDAKPLSAWKRNVMATSVAAVLTCVGMPAIAQPGLCTSNNANDATGTGVACGDSAKAPKAGAIAVGNDATADGDDAIAVGNAAQALANDSIALGAGAEVQAGAVGSIALGTGSIATAAGEFSIGDVGSNLFRRITGVADGTDEHDAATIGQLVTATQQNHAVKYDWQDEDSDGIADANEVNYSKVTMGGTPYDDATGAGGTTITNVADGVSPSDAVNRSQLDELADTPISFAGNTGLVDKKLGETLSIKGEGSIAGTYSGANLKTVVDANGALQIQMSESPEFGSVVVNAGGTGKITGVTAGTADEDAVNMLQLTAVEDTANAGWNLSAAGNAATTTNVGPGETVNLSNTDGNLVVQKTTANDDVTFDLARNIAVDSVTMGDTSVNTDGLTIADGPSITADGIDADSMKITRVADGEDASDAVNMGQLDDVKGDLSDLADKPVTFAGNTGSVDRKLGETLSIQGEGTMAGTYTGANLKTEVDADGALQIQMTDAPRFGDVVINHHVWWRVQQR